MKYYHNPRCRKSREGLTLLNTKNIQYEIIEYLKTPLKKEELIGLLSCLNMEPMDLIRKGESVYKEKVKGKNLKNDEIIEIMIEEPKLIERPILLNKNTAIIGRPAENLLKIID
ncbi:MAG: arsenate reductase (glutaredoxin) [Flavobacteriales bacterium]|jgi:arsenate reductase|nr:arsenate reductase (glutaredoxin) [Flavobacteriales bacterium]